MLEAANPNHTPVRCVLHCRRSRPEALIDIAVLASGSGSNLQALVDTPAIRPHLAVVVSDLPGAGALERAKAAGIPTVVVEWEEHPDRDAFSAAVGDAIEGSGAKGVVLAGFMRILAPGFINRFPHRIINVHPSLLPAFPGANAVESALEHSVKLTGVTVHFVDEEVDHGPIIAQVPVEVYADDTVETLHTRIKIEEHRLYPAIVESFVQGRLTVVGRTVVFQ